MDKELLLKYKEKNPEKFAQKFGHLNLDEIEATTEEVVVEEKKEEEVELPSEDKEDSE